MDFAESCLNAAADAIEADIGASPTFEFRTGAKPADTDAADSGTLISEIQCPADFLDDAALGVKQLAGVWEDAAADDAGIIGHFRMKTAGGVCKIQGTVTLTGGGGDMEVQNTNVQAGQKITVTAFQLTVSPLG